MRQLSVVSLLVPLLYCAPEPYSLTSIVLLLSLSQVSVFQNTGPTSLSLFILTYISLRFPPTSLHPCICVLLPFTSLCFPISLSFTVSLFHSLFPSVPLFHTHTHSKFLSLCLFFSVLHSVDTQMTFQG